MTELVDASSFLVAPQAPDNPVSDLRWSAGALLGSIDWVAEKFIGFSILDRCVFHPFAGDWQGIYKASEAWNHAGDAAQAMTRNHAGLVASHPADLAGAVRELVPRRDDDDRRRDVRAERRLLVRRRAGEDPLHGDQAGLRRHRRSCSR